MGMETVYIVNQLDGSLTFGILDVPLSALIRAADERFAGIPKDKIEVYEDEIQGKYGRVALRIARMPKVVGDETDPEYGAASCHPQALYTLAQIIDYALLFPQRDFDSIKVNTDAGFGPRNYIFLRML